MALVFEELCNGGADGVAATTGNTSFGELVGDGTSVFDTDQAIEGDTSLLFSTRRQAEFAVPQGGLFHYSLYARFSGAPDINCDLCFAFLAGTIRARIRLEQVGQERFRLLDQSATVAMGSHVMIPNQWYRLEWTIDSVAGEQTLRIYTGANLHTLIPTETIGPGVYTASDIDEFSIGRFASVNIDTHVDRLLIDDAVMPDPFQQLSAQYAFSEGAGATVADSSGNGRDLAVLQGQWVAGHTGSGMQGGPTTVDSGASVAYDQPIEACTIMGWVKPLSFSGNIFAFGFNDNMQSTFFAIYTRRNSFGPGGVIQANVLAGGGLLAIGMGAGSALNVWEHLAITWDGTSIRCYVDCSLVATNTPGSALPPGGSTFMVAGWGSNESVQNVVVDDVRVFESALSESAIETQMNTDLEGGGGTNYQRSAGTLSLGLALNVASRQFAASRSAQAMQLGLNFNSPSRTYSAVRSANTLPFSLGFGQPHHSELNMEPELLGNGSLIDRIMASLTTQGFTEGSVADRERRRLISKLALPSGAGLSLADLYEEANEPNRLLGTYGAAL